MPFPNHVEAFLARRQALVERTNAQLLRMQARRDALEAAGQALLAWREWLAQYDPRVEEWRDPPSWPIDDVEVKAPDPI